MQKYDIKNKTVWYNPQTNRAYKNKTKGCIRFDSLSEYRLYKNLQSFLICNLIDSEITVHKKLYIGKNKFWLIDFAITFDDKHLDYFIKVLKLINKTINKGQIKNTIYIEYKGVLNKQYLAKQKLLTENMPNIDNKVIILSDEAKAILMESENLHYNIKYVHSTNYFFEVLKQCLQQH